MIIGIIQARTSSSRLPGKVLKDILGRPMILHQIFRHQKSKFLDEIIIATSKNEDDDLLADILKKQRILVSRGSLDDVLDRFYEAAKRFEPAKEDYIVRLTGDCPLHDPDVLDEVIQTCVEGSFDYYSNGLEPHYPDGLDVEMFRFGILEQIHQIANLPSEREHVTSYIHTRLRNKIKFGAHKPDFDLSHHRWTVDTPKDFYFVRKVYESIYPKNHDFGMYDVLALLEREPDLIDINASSSRNEGYIASLNKDKGNEGG